jgi:tetratricopeptide (TPR) repeat protein
MSLKFSGLISLDNWRAASSYFKAMGAHRKGDYKSALTHFERAMRLDRLRTSEHMAFYASLMALSKRPAEEGLQMFTRVASGEFRRDNARSKYAEAFAHYWIAFLTNRSDVVPLWLDAYKLKPSKGFAARELPLPDNPLLQ